MTTDSRSPEYRDLLSGKITAEQYVEKMKLRVSARLKTDRRTTNVIRFRKHAA